MSNKSHIMRLYKLREAFACIDYSDASSDSLRSLLQRVASNPLCLKLPEGRKLLASLLTCDGILVRDLHMAFRSQIPNAKNTVLDAYGEIYHRAWKDAFTDDENNGINVYDDDEGDGDYEADNRDTDDKSLSDRDTSVRKSIEHLVLQDLMHASIHVASSAMQTSILHVLEPFHADKKTDHVANLLFRLYSPIVWRSLTAANPSIRCNALVILEKAFPLHNPKRSLISFSGQSSGTWTTKDAVLKATAAIQAALKDPYPQVRITASQAAARICAVYWEVLPSKEIHTLLNSKFSMFIYYTPSLFYVLFPHFRLYHCVNSPVTIFFSTSYRRGSFFGFRLGCSPSWRIRCIHHSPWFSSNSCCHPELTSSVGQSDPR